MAWWFNVGQATSPRLAFQSQKCQLLKIFDLTKVIAAASSFSYVFCHLVFWSHVDQPIPAHFFSSEVKLLTSQGFLGNVGLVGALVSSSKWESGRYQASGEVFWVVGSQNTTQDTMTTESNKERLKGVEAKKACLPQHGFWTCLCDFDFPQWEKEGATAFGWKGQVPVAMSIRSQMGKLKRKWRILSIVGLEANIWDFQNLSYAFTQA